jgi:hypothetical protein
MAFRNWPSCWCSGLPAPRSAAGSGRSAAALNFAFVFGGSVLAALIARYQLHSYFSDAVDFALLKNLGGGSVKDALLFAKNEIALGLAGLALVLAAWWLILKLLRTLLRREGAEPTAQPRWKWAGAACALWLVALTVVPAPARTRRAGSSACLAGARPSSSSPPRPTSTAMAMASSGYRPTRIRSTPRATRLPSTSPATASTRTAMPAT